LGSAQAGAEDVELPTFPAPVFVLRMAEGTMTRLILTSSAGATLMREDFADAVVFFTFRFVWGPLPSPDELAAYLATRPDQRAPRDHWSIFGRRRDGSKTFEDLGFVEFCRQCETVELWFDLGTNDQLLLIWLLDHFRSHPDIVARLRLRLVDFELISIPRRGLGNWKVQDIGVSGAELETASRAWQAYQAPTPEACFALLATDLSALPLLRLALLHLLAELPSSTTGLGATEMRMLELLAWGFANANPLFHFRDLRGTYVFSEGNTATCLMGLRLVRFLPWPVSTTSYVRSAGKTWVLAIRPFSEADCP
jgi:hypothetical protein